MPILLKSKTLRFLKRLNGMYPKPFSRKRAIAYLYFWKEETGGSVEIGKTYMHLDIKGAGTVMRFVKSNRLWKQENLSL